VSLDLMPDAEAALISKEFIEALEKCFNKIPSRYSEVLTMKYLEEKTIAEIAENLNISYSNVKIRLYRARQLLAECLRKSGVIQ
jgi:RNA polymerase sigma factor (sigma-70 family)